MLCNRCKKRLAVVFINKIENGKQTSEGLCLKCAGELGIKAPGQMLENMGISEDDFNELSDEMGEFFDGMGGSDFADNLPFFSGQTGGSEGGEKEKTKKDAKPGKQSKKSTLETYGTNLTKKAADGELDCVIGREKEITRVLHILNRRTKNNPVLLGEPGVGKTAVAEAVAIHIADGLVPPKLAGFQVYLIDFTALLAGTQFRGQFEARLKSLLNEAKERKNVILVIDELHNIVSAGDAEGAMNAANILKPALARGEIRVIGATTLTEYRKHIEKDTALERRFAPVIIEEPSVEDSIKILKGLKPYYETFHSIILNDDAIEAAVNLSKRYIPERFLPDKAIDLIDECGSEKNLKNTALARLTKINLELSSIAERQASLQNPELPPESVDYAELADLKMREMKLGEEKAKLEAEGVATVITVQDIAKVIESLTGIPVTDLTEKDSERLLSLEDNIKKRIVGQDKAVEAVSRVIRRSRAGLTGKKRPASFIFVGPTGVGKTELVKTLAKELFGSEEAIIRFDMSEYMEKHTVSKLIGSPPGYVGYDDAGLLTEKVRRKPYSVILLDEIEKAHADVFNILLQVLDDGKLTDSHGKTVHFENSVIIMTSNAGSDYRSASFGFVENEGGAYSNKTDTALKEIFRPEFLNRVDEIISFSPLSEENLLGIVDILIGDLSKDISAKGITLSVTEKAKKYLVAKGYDKKFGARPLKRLIQKEIESELAEMFIRNTLKSGQSVTVDSDGEKLLFEL